MFEGDVREMGLLAGAVNPDVSRNNSLDRTRDILRLVVVTGDGCSTVLVGSHTVGFDRGLPRFTGDPPF